MIKISDKAILEILANLPPESKILDVGGASAPFKRATHMIDIVPYEEICWSQARGISDTKFTKETYTRTDICAKKDWPYQDKYFDYSICSHVLEDIRDPIWVCSEIIRVSRAGYIEIPSAKYEKIFNLEARGLSGAAHHRWLIDLFENKIRFTFKYVYIHSHAVNKSKDKLNLNDPSMYLRVEWSDSFGYFENWLNSGREIFEYYLGEKITDKQMWKMYRKNSPRSFIPRYLAYLKNTNKTVGGWYKKWKK